MQTGWKITSEGSHVLRLNTVYTQATHTPPGLSENTTQTYILFLYRSSPSFYLTQRRPFKTGNSYVFAEDVVCIKVGHRVELDSTYWVSPLKHGSVSPGNI